MATGRKGAKPVGHQVTRATAGDDLLSTVRGLAEVVTEHNLSELVVSRGDTSITLRRGGQVVQQVAMSMPSAPMSMPIHHAPTGPAARAAEIAPLAPVDDGSHIVTSPFVGTFYRRPNPDSAEYVKLNGHVDKGAVLCIVEAMKLMNEIEADVSGTVVAVLAADNSVVEFGQPLFKIRPA